MASRSRPPQPSKSRPAPGAGKPPSPKSNRTLPPDGAANGTSNAKAAPRRPAPVEAAPSESDIARDEARFWLLATALLVVGIALRQWRLDAFPIHPDEAIHANYGADLPAYNYDPTYHGPLMYHLEAIVMRFLGVNDFTARLVPSLLGISLLVLVIGPARRLLGMRGTLWSLALLALSPVMVTYSRRLLHDSLALFLTMAAVLCFQTTREKGSGTRSGGWARVGLILVLTLFLTTKANAFFILAMLAAFWLAEWARDHWAFRLGTAWRYLPVGVTLLVGLNAHYSSYPVSSDGGATYHEMAGFPLSGAIFRVACVVGCGLLWLWVVSGPRSARDDAGPRFVSLSSPAPRADTEDLGEAPAVSPQADEPHRASIWPYLLGAFAAFWVFAFLYGHGIKWFGGGVPVRAGIAEALSPGVWNGGVKSPADGALTQMLKYWGGQQARPRLPGPHDYYVVLLALYELPIMLVALAGMVRACRARSPWLDLLVWWSVTSFVLYSLANEKVPWLMAHLILPMALLGGWWLGEVWRLEGARRARPVALRTAYAALALSAVFLLRNVSACNFERGADNHEPMFYAQDTNDFHDTFLAAVNGTAPSQGGIWVDNGRGPHGESWSSAQWPLAWTLRDGAFVRRGSEVYWDSEPGRTPAVGRFGGLLKPVRAIVTSPERWQQVSGRYPGFHIKNVEFYIWGRASWPALLPEPWFKFWWWREVNPGNGTDHLLAPPGEWSSNRVLIASKGSLRAR